MDEPTTVATEEPTTAAAVTSMFGDLGAFFQGIIDIILKVMDAIKQIVEGAKA